MCNLSKICPSLKSVIALSFQASNIKSHKLLTVNIILSGTHSPSELVDEADESKSGIISCSDENFYYYLKRKKFPIAYTLRNRWNVWFVLKLVDLGMLCFVLASRILNLFKWVSVHLDLWLVIRVWSQFTFSLEHFMTSILI